MLVGLDCLSYIVGKIASIDRGWLLNNREGSKLEPCMWGK